MTDIELTLSDRGRTVPVRLGDLVTLSLPENATTGVRWSLPESDAIEIVADENVAREGAIGAEGLRVLTFRPARSGPMTLELIRRQAWESEQTADATFAVELDVK